ARAIHRWIADQFKLHAAKADPEACRKLADLVGDDLYELAGEVEKLATWAAGDEVTETDVDALVAPRAESPPWNLTDAWGARDADLDHALKGGSRLANELELERALVEITQPHAA